jgi:hypothetical protein
MRKTVILLAVLFAGVTALCQTSCTYSSAGDTFTAHCTMPDGSGADTYYSPVAVTEHLYTPLEWSVRLATLTKADEQYARDIQRITEESKLQMFAAGLRDKKTCRAAGFVWHRDGLVGGWCTAL